MILVVEDNTVIADNISEYLEIQGVETLIFYNGESAYEYIVEKAKQGGRLPQGILLDRMMPKLDGLGLARMLKTRGFHIPIIFLTALDKPVDRLEGLEVGAIDYLSKPVELKELSLKIKNLLDVTNSVHKKQDWEVPAPIHTIATACDHPGVIGHSSIQIDTDILLDRGAKQVTIQSKPVNLSPKEYGIIELLAIHQGQVVTYDSLLEHVWHESSERLNTFQGSITVHIAYLRKKLNTPLIRTVKLSGYILDFPQK